MKALYALAVLAVCALPMSSHAQYQLRFTFRGTSYETASDGTMVSRHVTEQTLLKDIAEAAGVTDTSNWRLVYHVGGNELGDTVEVVNATTGAVLDTYFGLYFGKDAGLGRMSLTGKDKEKIVDYVYTKQNSHSMGASFTTKYKVGTRSYIEGRIQYVMAPQGSHGIRMYSGIFHTGNVVKFGR